MKTIERIEPKCSWAPNNGRIGGLSNLYGNKYSHHQLDQSRCVNFCFVFNVGKILRLHAFVVAIQKEFVKKMYLMHSKPFHLTANCKLCILSHHLLMNISRHSSFSSHKHTPTHYGIYFCFIFF